MCRSGDEDHPRRCGENACRLAKSLFVHGSPPRMRGKPNSATRAVITCRITPAGAGKTEGVYLFAPPKEDHPRRCGENRASMDPFTANNGSPPQVRGKHNATHQSIADNRITPAGAGKTRRDRKGEITTWDHPRRCGENPTAQTTTFLPTGSPPQVRGKLHPTEGTLSAFRITPAGAGKTSLVTTACNGAPDHPRRCGENYWRQLRCLCWAGSPPQVRGKRVP